MLCYMLEIDVKKKRNQLLNSLRLSGTRMPGKDKTIADEPVVYIHVRQVLWIAHILHILLNSCNNYIKK